MKKFMISVLLFSLALPSFAQEEKDTLFYDSFEEYEDWIFEDIGDWTLLDLDGEDQIGILGVSFPNNEAHPFAAKIVNSTTAVTVDSPINIPDVRNYEARTGEKVIGMFAALLPSNNDWLITPKITLGEGGNELSFFAKSAQHDNQKHEKFRVLISTTDTNPESFIEFPPVYEEEYFTETEWTEILIDLDEYKNQEIYIAINYISSIYDNPQYPPHLQKRALALLIDDFKVVADKTLGLNDQQKNVTSLYPNPVIDNLEIKSNQNFKEIRVYNLDGKIIKKKKLLSNSINLSDLIPGTYIAQLIGEDTISSHKIIKK